MAIGDHARFCSLCAQNVSDLVNWTDEEIIKFLNKADHKVCGRLSYEQMGRIISDYETPKINNWNKVVASALLMTSTISTPPKRTKVTFNMIKIIRQKQTSKRALHTTPPRTTL